MDVDVDVVVSVVLEEVEPPVSDVESVVPLPPAPPPPTELLPSLSSEQAGKEAHATRANPKTTRLRRIHLA